ncbi:helix-turn-helix transcriptional regulator, partial [Strepomyces sp. STD 3.1]|nr:helix-turn-helix transcriptional regulator [Streptomyces sp. STD 3.1]
TTAELGRLSKTSQSTISGLERGERFVTFDSMIDICDVLGVGLYDVLPPEYNKNLKGMDETKEKSNIILDRLSVDDTELIENLVINYMPLLRIINELDSTQKKHLTMFLNSIANNKY